MWQISTTKIKRPERETPNTERERALYPSDGDQSQTNVSTHEKESNVCHTSRSLWYSILVCDPGIQYQIYAYIVLLVRDVIRLKFMPEERRVKASDELNRVLRISTLIWVLLVWGNFVVLTHIKIFPYSVEWLWRDHFNMVGILMRVCIFLDGWFSLNGSEIHVICLIRSFSF